MRLSPAFQVSVIVVVFTFGTAASGQKAPAPTGPGGVDYWMQVGELTASNGTAGDGLGNSMAVSGNVAVLGATGANGETGAAYVFIAPASGWTNLTQVAELTASDGIPGDAFGTSVSIAGNTIVVGAPNHAVGSNGSQGTAYVFVKPANGWVNMTQTAELTASDGAALDNFAASVGIGGNTVAVGTTRTNISQGAAYVFVEPTGGWTNMTQTAKLTASDGSITYPLGASVAVSGGTVVAGTGHLGGASKGAYVFVEPAGGWVNSTQRAKLMGSVGASVAISGNTIVAGAPQTAYLNDPGNGFAYVFVKPPTGWVTTSKFNAKLVASDANGGDAFGFSVSINSNVIVAGAPYAHCTGCGTRHKVYGPGLAYVFVQPTGGWKGTLTQDWELSATGGQPGDQFGFSVTNNGKTVLAKGITADQTASTGYVFGYVPNTGWTSFLVPGSSSTFAYGVNNLGQITGLDGQSLGGNFGFVDTAGTFATLDYPASLVTTVTDINDSGEAVGWYQPSSGQAQGFTEQNGVYTTLSYPGATLTEVLGVNNLGDMVGLYQDSSGQHGFLYSGGVFSIIDPPNAATCSVLAYKINNAGEVVGSYSVPPCQAGIGFTYSNGIFTDVTYPGAMGTGLFGVNDNGDLTGAWSGSAAGQGGSFVYWNQTQQFDNFNVGGIDASSALGINNSGEVVGWFLSSRGTYSGPVYGFYGHLPGH
jgi:hypothetical protein